MRKRESQEGREKRVHDEERLRKKGGSRTLGKMEGGKIRKVREEGRRRVGQKSSKQD